MVFAAAYANIFGTAGLVLLEVGADLPVRAVEKMFEEVIDAAEGVFLFHVGLFLMVMVVVDFWFVASWGVGFWVF